MPSPSKRTINCNVISSAGPVSIGEASYAGQMNRVIAEGAANLCTEGCNGHETDHSDQPDQHTIFDQGRPVLIPAEAVDQFAHLTFLFKVLYRAHRRRTRSRTPGPLVR